LHVGDTLEIDVYGAERAGLRAVLLDPAGRYTGRRDVLIVKNLAELCSLLEP
jgi:FMN phosphatase YigB (HAD superfamily)